MDHSEELLLKLTHCLWNLLKTKKGGTSLWLSDLDTGFLFTAVGWLTTEQFEAKYMSYHWVHLEPFRPLRLYRTDHEHGEAPFREDGAAVLQPERSAGFRNFAFRSNPEKTQQAGRVAFYCACLVKWCFVSADCKCKLFSFPQQAALHRTWRGGATCDAHRHRRTSVWLFGQYDESDGEPSCSTRWSPFCVMCSSEKLTDRCLNGERWSALAVSPTVSHHDWAAQRVNV